MVPAMRCCQCCIWWATALEAEIGDRFGIWGGDTPAKRRLVAGAASGHRAHRLAFAMRTQAPYDPERWRASVAATEATDKRRARRSKTAKANGPEAHSNDDDNAVLGPRAQRGGRAPGRRHPSFGRPCGPRP